MGLSTTVSATSGTTVGSTTLYTGRHNIVAWTGYATFDSEAYWDFNCTQVVSPPGAPLSDVQWLTIPSLTWKACLLEASMRGAQVLSASGGPWATPGWFAVREPASTRVMIGIWNTYTSDNLSNTRNCTLIRDRQSGTNRDAPLANTTSYDGDTWKYQDMGVMYLDQCEKLASGAGASIITPWTIRLVQRRQLLDRPAPYVLHLQLVGRERDQLRMGGWHHKRLAEELHARLHSLSEVHNVSAVDLPRIARSAAERRLLGVGNRAPNWERSRRCDGFCRRPTTDREPSNGGRSIRRRAVVSCSFRARSVSKSRRGDAVVVAVVATHLLGTRTLTFRASFLQKGHAQATTDT